MWEAIYFFLNNNRSKNNNDEDKEIEFLDVILHCVKLACAEAWEKEIVDIVTLAAMASSSETIGSTLLSKISPVALFLQIAMALYYSPAVVPLIKLLLTADATSNTPTKKIKKKD